MLRRKTRVCLAAALVEPAASTRVHGLDFYHDLGGHSDGLLLCSATLGLAVDSGCFAIVTHSLTIFAVINYYNRKSRVTRDHNLESISNLVLNRHDHTSACARVLGLC